MQLEKCPCCGNLTLQKVQPPAGDAMFISAFDSKNNTVLAGQGIFCDIYHCAKCGSIQLKTKTQ